MNTAERQTFSDLLSRPGMDEALMGMMRSFSQVIAASSEKEKKTGKDNVCTFTLKEIDKMPQKYKKLFKIGSVIAHINYRKKDGVYEVRCQINNQKYYGCSKKLEIAKLKFVEDLNRPVTAEELNSKPVRYSPMGGKKTKSPPAIEYFKNWLETIKKPTIKQSTYFGYVQLGNKNVAEMFDGVCLNAVTTHLVQTKFNELISAGQFRTAQKLKNLLGDMFKFALNNGDIALNPLANVTVPKHDAKHGEAITRQEEKSLVEMLDTGNKYVQALVFMLYTGMRVGEVSSAAFDEDGWITCVSEKVRFGLKDKVRHIPISPMLKRVIDKIDISVVTSLARDTIIKYVSVYLPGRTSKDLRHTFITRCRECKIQREVTSVWSGHISDNSMTTKVYTHLSGNKQLQLEEIALFDYEL